MCLVSLGFQVLSDPASPALSFLQTVLAVFSSLIFRGSIHCFLLRSYPGQVFAWSCASGGSFLALVWVTPSPCRFALSGWVSPTIAPGSVPTVLVTSASNVAASGHFTAVATTSPRLSPVPGKKLFHGCESQVGKSHHYGAVLSLPEHTLPHATHF